MQRLVRRRAGDHDRVGHTASQRAAGAVSAQSAFIPCRSGCACYDNVGLEGIAHDLRPLHQEVTACLVQTVYAARDALLAAYAYRQLRAWHEAVVDPALETRICEVQTPSTQLCNLMASADCRDSTLCCCFSFARWGGVAAPPLPRSDHDDMSVGRVLSVLL